MKKTGLMSTLILGISLIFGCTALKSVKTIPSKQDEIPPVQREFRGVWVATVDNIDWPSRPGLSTAEQQQEAIAILDTVQKLNMNAVVFQVRPQCDAFYQSDLEPWSYYLTGVQGQAPKPFYDPLQFWIEQAHKRGLELHAWFNPYRAHHPAGGPVTEYSIVSRKPELAKKLENGYYWLDPAKPETKQHSLHVVMDVLRRYDIDGVHFDDYFYPYPSYNDNKDFPDEDTWQAYLQNGGKLSRGDWRREAVNSFIHTLYQQIKKEKPWVKLGISPFGIYRPHQPYSITGFDQYEVLYADARLWLQQGWLDYFTPQLYWPINRIAQSFPVLLGYWDRENFEQRHLWPGLYTSKVKDSVGVDENLNQIMIERGIVDLGPGHIHFSMKAFQDSIALLNKALIEGPYSKQALIPGSPWLDSIAPETPQIKLQTSADSLMVQWSHPHPQDVRHWVLYYELGKHWQYVILDAHQTKYLLPGSIVISFKKDEQPLVVKLNRIALSAVDRSGNESEKQIILIK